jgi:hypothetical protein
VPKGNPGVDSEAILINRPLSLRINVSCDAAVKAIKVMAMLNGESWDELEQYRQENVASAVIDILRSQILSPAIYAIKVNVFDSTGGQTVSLVEIIGHQDDAPLAGAPLPESLI